MTKQVFLFIFFFFLSLSGYTQNFLGWKFQDRYFSLSFGTGQTAYFGELDNGRGLLNGLNNFTLSLEARLYARIGARAEFTYYNIEGDDIQAADSSFNRQRNLSFFSNNFEFKLEGVFYPFKYVGDYHRRRPFDPYFTAGIGFTTFNPKTTLDSVTYTLRDFETEGVSYGSIALVLPVGAGIKLRLNEFLGLNFEANYRFTFEDYIDDVSNTYGGPFSDPIRQALSNRNEEIGVINEAAFEAQVPGGPRGDPDTKDTYLMVQARIEWYIPPDLFQKKTRANKQPLFMKP